MGSETYHEPYEILSPETREMHRAIVSLMEELEAIDWYQQRADGCSDPGLRDILVHNKDEEVEHAMMTLEWIRRRSEVFDREMRTYLFTEGPILEQEAQATGKPAPASESTEAGDPEASRGSIEGDGSLRVRGLR